MRGGPSRAKRISRSPFLRRIHAPQTLRDGHPFDIPIVASGLDITFTTPVTFFVGENGSGKSTLLEAVAERCGFNPEGGSRDHHREVVEDRSPLAQALRLEWRPRVTEGFFLRAESFFNFASYLEGVSNFSAYGGKSLHAQSHGESFLALFTHRFEQGIFILDEPEAALSPQRQLSFLRILYDLAASGGAQFLVATHSPMLLTLPGATILSLDGERIELTTYQDTSHFQVTRDFLNGPEQFYKHLLAPPPSDDLDD